ncbi:MAG TPA: nuclear transport factor 2 family protein [Chitinophagaceae bacterium]|nr:nuclear transport factor 2 family protein [Chitinophagaceae bacterium]
MKPKEVVQKWINAFNNADVEAIADFYAENAINHQVNTQPVEGKEAIKKMFAEEFSRADMVCIMENIFEDGEWAILEWKDPLGLRGCGFFHIQEGKIIFQRGYWDKLSFLRLYGLPIPKN